MKKDNEKKGSEVLTNFLNKTTDISKKAAGHVQKGVKNLSEKIQQDNYERKMKKLNPLMPEDFKNENFHLPNVIKIVDDAVRRDNELCEGAIGWCETVNETEILFLYDEYVRMTDIVFIPVEKCDSVYCVDPFDRSRFIQADSIFGKATEERIAELEHIAYSLGAKKCSIEIVEENSSGVHSKHALQVSATASANASYAAEAYASNKQSGKTITCFKGNDLPQKPKLKWFAHDDHILGLIEMRCADHNGIQKRTLQLKGSTSATMSQKTAIAIDKILKIKGGISMEKQATKEMNSKLIFDIEF